MNIIFAVIGAVFIILFLLPLFHRVFNMGTAAGVGIGSAYILLGVMWHRLDFTLSKYCAFFGVTLLFLYIFLCAKVMSASRGETSGKRVLIVLGCRIRGDVPSLALEKRIESAFFFLMENPEAVAILSGGQGADENLSEGLCIYQHLVKRGISKNRLFIEDKSVNTDENIRFSLNIIEKNGFDKSVAICTSEYHQLRARMICERYGLNAVPCSSKTLPVLIPTFVTRELLGIVKEKLLPNIKIK